MHTILFLMLAMGCKRPPVAAPSDFDAVPRLPSPQAGTYARVPLDAPDPVVAAVTHGHRWDASLSGACAGLALDAVHAERPITTWATREAAWRAGYPYPVTRVRAWSTPQGAEAPEQLLGWLAELTPADDLGLVRARSDSFDAWVAMVATPRAEVGVQPRQVGVGGIVELPEIAGAAYAVASPSGQLVEGGLQISQRFHLDVAGEWLFEVSDKEGTIALFPVYAGLVPPDTALFDEITTSSTSVEQRIDDLIREIRGVYGAPELTRDPMLDSAARAVLQARSTPTDRIAESLGFEPRTFSRWECSASTIEGCLDSVLWNPRSRPGLLGDTHLIGLAIELNAGTVRVVALMAPGS